MRTSTQQIIELVDSYLNRAIGYEEFYSAFNDILLTSPNVDDQEAHLEWDINDRLAYAAEDPIGEESRRDGFIGAEELRQWLSNYKTKHSDFWNN